VELKAESLMAQGVAPVEAKRRAQIAFGGIERYLVLDILSDPVARIGGFGSETPLDFPFRAAAKTGTSRHYTDNWAVAVTARFTVAVWVGNFSGRPMQKVSGITGAGPLLQRAVLETARRFSPGDLVDPERAGLVATPVCILSGSLVGRRQAGSNRALGDRAGQPLDCRAVGDGRARFRAGPCRW
jgi:penicillin-binding protein 1C